MVAGICGGMGDYFEIDPVLLRVVWVMVLVLTAFVMAIVIYVIAIFIIPLEPEAAKAAPPSGVQPSPGAEPYGGNVAFGMQPDPTVGDPHAPLPTQRNEQEHALEKQPEKKVSGIAATSRW